MNTNFLNSVTNFLKKRTFELLGLILILTGIALAISFATYAPEDPSFIYGDSNIEIKNLDGLNFNPLSNKWKISSDNSVNYIAKFKKN